MNLFYKPKHLKKQIKPKPVLTFIYSETTWYMKWWKGFIVSIFHKLYEFGEWMLAKSHWLIDYIDEL